MKIIRRTYCNKALNIQKFNLVFLIVLCIICLCYFFSHNVFITNTTVCVCVFVYLFCKRNSKNKKRKPSKVISTLILQCSSIQWIVSNIYNRRRRWERRQCLTTRAKRPPVLCPIVRAFGLSIILWYCVQK